MKKVFCSLLMFMLASPAFASDFRIIECFNDVQSAKGQLKTTIEAEVLNPIDNKHNVVYLRISIPSLPNDIEIDRARLTSSRAHDGSLPNYYVQAKNVELMFSMSESDNHQFNHKGTLKLTAKNGKKTQVALWCSVN